MTSNCRIIELYKKASGLNTVDIYKYNTKHYKRYKTRLNQIIHILHYICSKLTLLTLSPNPLLMSQFY